jgi:hypothetical protein
MQKKRDDIADVSNAVSHAALICLCAIFVIIVTYGWSKILAPVLLVPYGWSDLFEPIFAFFKYLVALLIAGAGIILGKAVAAERIRISEEEEPKFTRTWIAYFALLLVISALGTMNSLFMGTQQNVVLADVISETSGKLRELNAKVVERLPSEYEAQSKRVKNLTESLKAELRAPGNCGFGTQATVIFRELQTILPELKRLSVGASSCDEMGPQILSYEQQIQAQTGNLPSKRQFDEREALISRVKKESDAIEQLKVKAESLDKDTALPLLKSAWNTYAGVLKEAELKAGSSFGMPQKIENEAVGEMGSLTRIFELMAKRLDSPVTYLIIFVAVLFDVLLVQFFARYLHGRVKSYAGTGGLRLGTSGQSRVKNLFED